MMDTYRILRLPNGTYTRARVVPHEEFSLGTQLDRFFLTRKTEPPAWSRITGGTRA